MNANPLQAWPLHSQLRGLTDDLADNLCRDDVRLGEKFPDSRTVFTSPRLAWSDFEPTISNAVVEFARGAWLVQDGRTPQLVLIFDVDDVRRLMVRPTGKKKSPKR